MKPLRVAAVTQCTLDSFNSGGIGAADGALGRHAFRATLWPPVGEESRHSLSLAVQLSSSYARTHAFGMSRASPQSAVESPPCIRIGCGRLPPNITLSSLGTSRRRRRDSQMPDNS